MVVVTTGRAKYGNCSKWFPLRNEPETEEGEGVAQELRLQSTLCVLNLLMDDIGKEKGQTKCS